MQDLNKTKAQLIEELSSLRQNLAPGEASSGDFPLSPESHWEDDMARRYLDIAGVIILALNKKGEITLINKKGSEVLGWPEKDLIGRNWFEHFVLPSLREEIRSVFQQLMSGEKEKVAYHVNPIITRSG